MSSPNQESLPDDVPSEDLRATVRGSIRLAPTRPCCEHPRMSAEHVQLHRSPSLARGVPYAYGASTTTPGRVLFTAGACPLDESGATVGVGDLVAQAEQVMVNLRVALEDAGAGLADVLMTHVYVASTSREDLAPAWEVVRRHLGDHDAPGTLLGVTVLGWPDQLVEVEAVAVVRAS